VRAAQLGADARQRRAGRVEHFAAVADGVLDVFGQPRVVAQENVRQLEQGGRLVAQWGQAAPPRARRLDRRGDVQQLLWAEDAADAGAFGRRAHVVDAAQVQARAQTGQLQGFGGCRLAPGRLREILGWFRSRAAPARRKLV
jgi:hypothetical protein